MTKKQSCKRCKWAEVPLNKNGKRHGSGPWSCNAPIPDLPALPESVWDCRWPPHKSAVWIDEGQECPVFEEFN